MSGRTAYLGVLAVLVLAGAGAAVVLRPASEAPELTLVNPGKFTGVAGPGSYYAYLDPAGEVNPLTYFDAGRPSCADGEDNDADGLVDAEDQGCAGEVDANERLAEAQPYTRTELSVKLKASGVMTLLPSDVRVQPVEKCAPLGPDGEVWCLLVSPRGAGPLQRGEVRAGGTELPLPLTIKLDAIAGYPGFDPRCEIGYTEHVYVAEVFDPAAGTVVFESARESEAPALRHCGEWTDFLNEALGLPAAVESRLVVSIRNDVGEAPQFR